MEPSFPAPRLGQSPALAPRAAPSGVWVTRHSWEARSRRRSFVRSFWSYERTVKRNVTGLCCLSVCMVRKRVDLRRFHMALKRYYYLMVASLATLPLPFPVEASQPELVRCLEGFAPHVHRCTPQSSRFVQTFIIWTGTTHKCVVLFGKVISRCAVSCQDDDDDDASED